MTTDTSEDFVVDDNLHITIRYDSRHEEDKQRYFEFLNDLKSDPLGRELLLRFAETGGEITLMTSRELGELYGAEAAYSSSSHHIYVSSDENWKYHHSLVLVEELIHAYTPYNISNANQNYSINEEIFARMVAHAVTANLYYESAYTTQVMHGGIESMRFISYLASDATIPAYRTFYGVPPANSIGDFYQYMEGMQTDVLNYLIDADERFFRGERINNRYPSPANIAISDLSSVCQIGGVINQVIDFRIESIGDRYLSDISQLEDMQITLTEVNSVCPPALAAVNEDRQQQQINQPRNNNIGNAFGGGG